MTTHKQESEFNKSLAMTQAIMSDKAKMAIYDAIVLIVTQLEDRHNFEANTKEVCLIANEAYRRLERECINRVLPA